MLNPEPRLVQKKLVDSEKEVTQKTLLDMGAFAPEEVSKNERKEDEKSSLERPNMGRKVECPKCGLTVDKRGLKSHMEGKRCKACRKRKEYREKGYAPIPRENLRKFLESRGVDVKYDIGGYIPGSERKPSQFRKVYYAPKEKIEKWEDNIPGDFIERLEEKKRGNRIKGKTLEGLPLISTPLTLTASLFYIPC